MSLTEDSKVVKNIIFSFHVQSYTKKKKKKINCYKIEQVMSVKVLKGCHLMGPT